MKNSPRSIGWLLLASVLGVSGCRAGDTPEAHVIPGPTGPSPVPTAMPYVWDTRDELEVWVKNNVSRGSMSIVGQGNAAAVRIQIDVGSTAADHLAWVLRSPDFDPPVSGVRSVSIRYSWTPLQGAPQLVPYDSGSAAFEVTSVAGAALPPSIQPHAIGAIRQGGPTDLRMTIPDPLQPVDVRYFYLYSDFSNRGVLKSIQLRWCREPTNYWTVIPVL